MYVSWKAVVPIGLIAVGAIVGFLLLQLNNANAELRVAEAEMKDQASLIAELREANQGFEQANKDLAKTNAALVSARDGMQSSLDRARHDLDIMETSLRGARNTLTTFREQLEAANARNAQLVNENNDLKQYQQDIYSTSGSLAQLQTEAERLRIEIETLEEQRKPLLLALRNASVGNPSCTGSMYPAITCMDRATWLEEFRVEDIVVGAIISFDPDCWEQRPNGRSTIHRVMDIRVENGVYYFWPKGDSNSEPDGCWVHQDNVNGYLIAIEKNAVPENSYLQSQVIAARVAYLVAADAYDRLALRHCGSLDVANCYFGQFYGEALAAYELTEETWYYYDCWYQNALDSEYPGHIPYDC